MTQPFARMAACYPDFSWRRRIEIVEEEVAEGCCWRRFRAAPSVRRSGAAGLCVNSLTFPPAGLTACPLTFHARGRRRLFAEHAVQKAIAHAFWQTCWAQGAIRLVHGQTFPVAFIPVDRAAPGRAVTMAHEIAAGHRVFGEENAFLRTLRQEPPPDIRWRNGRFSGDASAALLAWLQGRAFVDRFFGANAEISGPVRIERFVPVHGSHVLSRLLPAELEYFQPAELSKQGEAVAAANSGYFLNFPEEYMNPWCAMNDPVGLLIAAGHFYQLPLVRRAALLIDAAGRAKIARVSMQDVALQLPWEPYWRGGKDAPFEVDPVAPDGPAAVYTPEFRAGEAPGRQRSPHSGRMDLAVVFGRIVEAKTGGGVEIPANGVVISLPAVQPPDQPLPQLVQKWGNRVRFRLRTGRFGLEKIMTALGAGPLLLADGWRITRDYFEDEEEAFQPQKVAGGEVVRAGVAPTRFPTDTARTRAPRTVLGLTATGQLMLIVVDGRTPAHSPGATLEEAACLARALGCRTALNLDGGGSSALYLAAKHDLAPLVAGVPRGIVNVPSDAGHQDRLLPVPLLITSPRRPEPGRIDHRKETTK